MTGASVTAAIPAFNAERFLADAITSVLSQTYPCYECLVIDDGSSDRTADIARSFEGVRYLRQENGGDAAARNRAISEARGDFIAFLDADDVWLPHKIGTQMQLFEENPHLALVYSSIEEVDESLITLSVIPAARGGVALRNTLLVEKPYMTGIGSTALVALDVAKKTLFDTRLRASSDWAFAVKVAVNYPVDGVIEPLALYRQHSGYQVHEALDWVEHDMHLVWVELFTQGALPSGLMKYRRRAAANLDLSLAYGSYTQKEKRRAFRYLGRAFVRRPDRVIAAFWRRYMGPSPK